MLYTQIKDEIKKAMMAKDTLRLSVVRGVSASFTNELVAKGKTPQDELGDDDCIAVIKRLAKQRKESIDQFEKGGRQDLADAEKAELEILNTFLPQMMGIEEIKKIAIAKKEELNFTDKSKLGMLIGAILKETKGQADGGDVKMVVEDLFK